MLQKFPGRQHNDSDIGIEAVETDKQLVSRSEAGKREFPAIPAGIIPGGLLPGHIGNVLWRQSHFFSSAGQFVSKVIVVVLVRSPVSTAKRWPSALTSYNGSVRSGRFGKSS